MRGMTERQEAYIERLAVELGYNWPGELWKAYHGGKNKIGSRTSAEVSKLIDWAKKRLDEEEE